MLHVLIADDHPIIRRGLRQLFAEHHDLAPPGEAADANEVLRRIHGAEWDVLLLDLSMPGMSGLELLREVKRLRPRLPVLILSGHPEEQLGVRVLRAGAAGYLTKDSADEDVIRAIRKVAAGGKVVSPGLAELLADTLRPGTRTHEDLSDREYEVLRMIGEGTGVTEIAERLELSVKTISTYRARVLEKLGLSSTAQLMRYAWKAGVVVEAEGVPVG